MFKSSNSNANGNNDSGGWLVDSLQKHSHGLKSLNNNNNYYTTL